MKKRWKFVNFWLWLSKRGDFFKSQFPCIWYISINFMIVFKVFSTCSTFSIFFPQIFHSILLFLSWTHFPFETEPSFNLALEFILLMWKFIPALGKKYILFCCQPCSNPTWLPLCATMNFLLLLLTPVLFYQSQLMLKFRRISTFLFFLPLQSIW